MNIHPQFSGVYLKPAPNTPLESSPTGHGHFEYDGKSYYTTHEDTVTLRQARRNNTDPEALTSLYRELAEKAPIPTLASLAATTLYNATQNVPSNLRHLSQNTFARLFPNNHMTIGSPTLRRDLENREELDETAVDAIEVGLNGKK